MGQARDPKTVGILALIAAQCAIVGLWPGGAIGFMQSIVEDINLFAILVLVGLIASVFVLLVRKGMSFGYPEEIAQAGL